MVKGLRTNSQQNQNEVVKTVEKSSLVNTEVKESLQRLRMYN